jgi:hypothetical protein
MKGNGITTPHLHLFENTLKRITEKLFFFHFLVRNYTITESVNSIMLNCLISLVIVHLNLQC